jgi:hypothetical protein
MTIKMLLNASCLLLIIPTCLLSMESFETLESLEDSSYTFDPSEMDDIVFDDEDMYPFMDEYLDNSTANKAMNSIDPADIMTLLNLINAPQILETPFFLETNILNKRSLLDEPIFEPDRPFFPKNRTLGLHAFIRKTDRSNFTKTSTKLNSYLSLTEEILISKLQTTIDRIIGILPQSNIDIERIFNLFENMTVEERQAGFMLHAMVKRNKTTFRIMMPAYYLENNFSLTKEEQDAVANEFGVMEPEEERLFRKNHFICDKIGIGDTRLEIDQQILKRPSLTFRCGLQATIPTACAWGTGFAGSSYPKPSALPTFNLEPIFDAFQNPSPQAEAIARQDLAEFLLDSFDRIAANLIDSKMGNNRHLGVGFFVRTKTPLRAYMNNSFAERISLTNRVSAEFFLPATEKRFYIQRINEQEFNSRNFEDLSQASSNLAFLEEQFIQRIFLQALPTRIVPGAIFRWTNAACYKGQLWGFNFGTDFWIQSKDHFGKIYASPALVKKLSVQKAKPPFAQQSKLFGGVVWRHKSYNKAYYVSLNGDITFSNKGVGEDWGISLNFEANF